MLVLEHGAVRQLGTPAALFSRRDCSAKFIRCRWQSERRNRHEKKEKTRWFGIPKLFPYLKGYGRLVLADMIALGFIGSAMDAVIPLFQQYAIDHFIADRTLAGLGAFVALYILVMIVQTATNCVSALAACKAEMYIGRDLKRVCFQPSADAVVFLFQSEQRRLYSRARDVRYRQDCDDSCLGTHGGGMVCGVSGAGNCDDVRAQLAAGTVCDGNCAGAGDCERLFPEKLVFHHRRVREQNSKITSGFNEGITGAKTTKTLVIEEKMEREFPGLTGVMKRESVKEMHFRSLFMSTTAFAASAALSASFCGRAALSRCAARCSSVRSACLSTTHRGHDGSRFSGWCRCFLIL